MVEYIYKKLDKITFGVLDPKFIRKMSAAKIVTPEVYDKEGYPVDGGLMDVRLGVIDPGLKCKTCTGRLKECMGHFGYIELARPVVHIKYLKPILIFLNATCGKCNRILVSKEKIESLKEKKKLTKKKIFADAKSAKECPHCKAKQDVIKLEKPTSFVQNEIRLGPIEIRSRLEKIPDDDAKLLGFNPNYARPEWLILEVLPIAPVTIRPSITLESGERSEDDLTHKLGDIVRINQRLFENINAGAPEIIVEDLWDLLQYHVTTYFDNGIAQIPPARHRSGQALKTITERIKNKEGRFRHNLSGKRVNFSARTVISPDPKIKFNEVGIPRVIAEELTVPEKVTEWNIEWLKDFIKKGPESYPGANYVILLDGKKKKITDDTKEQLIETLQIGCIVERHLMDGDVAIFNRQPSLHRMSIMCHKVKVIPGRSFRLHPGVANPYNADFDGDEMNLHIPQTVEARSEADILMQVKSQIITPKNGLNVVGCADDAITGNYLLTKEMKLSRNEAIDILYNVGVRDFKKIKNQEVDGKEVFSSILPDDFDFVSKTKSGESVIIKKGNLQEGFIDKVTIGEENGTLIRSLYAQYGDDQGLDLLNKIFKLGVEVLLRKGFTMSISDTDIPKDVQSKNDSLIKTTYEKIEDHVEKYKKGKLQTLPGKSVEETLESMILKLLNNLRDKIGENVFDSVVSSENSTVLMARSGAKGNLLNLSQMSACVGQQALGGGRVKNGYKSRTLPVFEKDDLSPISKGFVARGYKNGLKPVEYFFHAMTGRDSLMDTALRTPKSGYLYRRLANALQDLKIEYDHTVRDANKKIVQFKYGDDGVDVSKSEGGIINIKRIVEEVKTHG
ncbi:DNA-directed RNA polymerase subunit A' [archaeon]|nr:DNA-directed RNA polymerase subunit A' [archaeon]|tara:strand:- start:10107 stop:12644 length:2538 start_codon:yes stop_codon:yes gene_type:complete